MLRKRYDTQMVEQEQDRRTQARSRPIESIVKKKLKMTQIVNNK